MSVINHDAKSLLQQVRVHEFVEVSSERWLVMQQHCHGVERLEAKIHELRLLMLHGEDHNEHDVLEILLVQTKEPLSAMLNDVHHEREEALAEVRIELEIIFYDCKGTLT